MWVFVVWCLNGLEGRVRWNGVGWVVDLGICIGCDLEG